MRQPLVLFSFFHPLLAIFQGRDAVDTFENATEITRVFKAQKIRNFANADERIRKKAFCLLNAQGIFIFDRGCTRSLLEKAKQMRHTHKGHPRKLLHRNLLGIVIFNVFDRGINAAQAFFRGFRHVIKQATDQRNC